MALPAFWRELQVLQQRRGQRVRETIGGSGSQRVGSGLEDRSDGQKGQLLVFLLCTCCSAA